MKKHIVSSLILSLALSGAVALRAHPEGHETEPPRPPAKPQMPESVPEIVAALDNQQQSLDKAVADGKLDRVAPHARTLNLLVKQLVEKSESHHGVALRKLAADHDKLTTELIKASNAGAKPETAALVEKLKGSLKALKAEAH